VYKEQELSRSRPEGCAGLTNSSRNSHKASKCSRTWHKKSFLLIEKFEKEHTTRSCEMWEDDIKKDLTKMWCDNVNCFHALRESDRLVLVNRELKFWVS
jgi:hypothetical protein